MQNQYMPQPEITTYTTAEFSEQSVFCAAISQSG